MEMFELGADSKRLLMEIRDRLPAATTPSAVPDAFQPWEIFGARSQSVLVAWADARGDTVWLPRGVAAPADHRRLYVRKTS